MADFPDFFKRSELKLVQEGAISKASERVGPQRLQKA